MENGELLLFLAASTSQSMKNICSFYRLPKVIANQGDQLVIGREEVIVVKEAKPGSERLNWNIFINFLSGQ